MNNAQIKKLLEKHLKLIDWSLLPMGCDHYRIIDHNGKDTGYTYFADRIEHEVSYDCGTKVHARFRIEGHIHKLKNNLKDVDAISVGTKNDYFVLFMNHDRRDD